MKRYCTCSMHTRAAVLVTVSATLFLKLNVPVAAVVSTIGLTLVTNDLLLEIFLFLPVPISASNASPPNDPKFMICI